MTMTSRERVLTALARQEPDRVPFDMGGTFASSIVIGAYEKLCRHLGVADPEPVFMRVASQTVLPAEGVLEKLHIDTRALLLGSPDGFTEEDDAAGNRRDEFGIVRHKPASSLYYDVCHSPLAGDITLADIESHPWPDPDDPGRYRGLRERAQALHEGTDYCVVLNLPLGFVHQTQFLRGFEDWFADLLLNPELAGILMDRVASFVIRVVENALEVCAPYVDVAMYADDLAVQNGPMFSPEIYRALIKPRQRKIFEVINRRSRARIMYHSCGSVVQFIDDLAEIGVDAVNPVQVSAADMDTRVLKERYGGKIAFWGAVDTHRVLPQGTPEEVRAETRRRLEDLMPGGGYVLNSVHNLQPDVPPENIAAMFEAGLAYGRY